MHDAQWILTLVLTHGGMDMQSEHASKHFCITPHRQLLLQPSQMNRLDIAPVRLVIHGSGLLFRHTTDSPSFQM